MTIFLGLHLIRNPIKAELGTRPKIGKTPLMPTSHNGNTQPIPSVKIAIPLSRINFSFLARSKTQLALLPICFHLGMVSVLMG